MTAIINIIIVTTAITTTIETAICVLRCRASCVIDDHDDANKMIRLCGTIVLVRVLTLSELERKKNETKINADIKSNVGFVC